MVLAAAIVRSTSLGNRYSRERQSRFLGLPGGRADNFAQNDSWLIPFLQAGTLMESRLSKTDFAENNLFLQSFLETQVKYSRAPFNC